MDNLSIMSEVPDQSHSVPMSPSVVSPAVSSPAVLPKTSAPIFTSWAIWFAPAALITLGLDLLSKQVLFAMPHSTEFPSWISLAYNQGVAWSLFAEHPWLVVGLTVVLIPVLAWVWWSQYRRVGRYENVAFGLVLGGALGNAVDRLGMASGQLPGVRDFLHVDLGFPPFNPWPTFNLADSGICVGFAVLVLLSFRPAATPQS